MFRRVKYLFPCPALFFTRTVIVLSWNNLKERLNPAICAGVWIQELTNVHLPTSWYMAGFGIAGAWGLPVVKIPTRKVVSNYGR
jgi:hypothetical protein